MKRGKLFKLLAVGLILTMMFSTNVFAAEPQAEGQEEEIQQAYSVPEHSFRRSFEFTQYAWGIPHILKVNVDFTIAYEYSDGLWYDIKYADIDVVSVYIDSMRVTDVDSVKYLVNSSVAYRVIRINSNGYVCNIEIGIDLNEYGDVTTYAYML